MNEQENRAWNLRSPRASSQCSNVSYSLQKLHRRLAAPPSPNRNSDGVQSRSTEDSSVRHVLLDFLSELESGTKRERVYVNSNLFYFFYSKLTAFELQKENSRLNGASLRRWRPIRRLPRFALGRRGKVSTRLIPPHFRPIADFRRISSSDRARVLKKFYKKLKKFKNFFNFFFKFSIFISL